MKIDECMELLDISYYDLNKDEKIDYLYNKIMELEEQIKQK